MKIFDCIIIGAGVVGTSIFNKLTRIGKSCLLLDKASDVATGASKANSGIVHAGYDPKPDSLKALLNVRGNKLYPQICKRLGVKLNHCGALVVGNDLEKIEALHQRAKLNGVETEIWTKDQIQAKVPCINDDITCALYAVNSYVVSPYLFTISLADEAILNGGEIALEEDLVSVNKKEYFEVKTQKSTFYCKFIINSAGASYNEVAKILGAEQKPLELRRGEYFVFDKNYNLDVPCTIFPLPSKVSKGILVTPTVDGNFLVGPTSDESDDCTKVTAEGLQKIKENVVTTIEGINFKKSVRQFSGVRVISGNDFVIEKSQLVEGIINLAGICSPGLSSAPAIAEMVVELLGFENEERQGLKEIEPYVMFKDKSKEEQQKLLAIDENYKKIVCKCEKITKGDVLFALNRPLKVHSVDAVKRRTNAGMGGCQGGFCFPKVVENIAFERKIQFENVLKENRGSEVAIGDIREVLHD